jgi:hypothetical protein
MISEVIVKSYLGRQYTFELSFSANMINSVAFVLGVIFVVHS